MTNNTASFIVEFSAEEGFSRWIWWLERRNDEEAFLIFIHLTPVTHYKVYNISLNAPAHIVYDTIKALLPLCMAIPTICMIS